MSFSYGARVKKTLSQLNITATILFFITLIITYLYPEVTNALMLNPIEARGVLMTLISFILLLSFLQSQLSLPWRIFCLIASFIVLIESMMMLGAFQSF